MRLALISIGLLVVVACAREPETAAPSSDAEADALTITGALSYRERIALPPDAVAYVGLEAVSDDAPARVIVEQRIALEGEQVPIAFSLTVAREATPPGYRYAVRGSVKNGAGELLWETAKAASIDPTQDRIELGVLIMTQAAP